jgi:NAD+ diphosphatase
MRSAYGGIACGTRQALPEEVGVEVGDLRYFGSQPWPFGRSLMIGFFAQYRSGDIVVDGEEIVEAHWFDLDRLPLLPTPVSIARKMIDAFIEQRGNSGMAQKGA